MKTVLNVFVIVALTVACPFYCVGYAAISDNMSVLGEVTVSAPKYDLYITELTPDSSAGVTVTATAGTTMFAKVTGGGVSKFNIEITNVSKKTYLFERVIEGAETGFEGVYSGTDITYELNGIAKNDEIASRGGTLSFEITITVPEGVTTESYILKFNFVEKIDVPGEGHFPEDMPGNEVSLVQRLSDILNRKYTTDIVTDSRDYLINETIQVRWSPGANPYVGSMDKNYAEQIEELFGDIINPAHLSFILKNEDLNYDGYSEIALYSTSDPLTSTSQWPSKAVCVYITVFTPVLDANKNIASYNMVCESLHGYAPEVRYGENDLTPSFSTDHWRDNIGYMVWNDATQTSDVYPVPEDALSNDGTKPFRQDYNSYYNYYQNVWYATTPYGNMLWQCLDGKIPYLY